MDTRKTDKAADAADDVLATAYQSGTEVVFNLGSGTRMVVAHHVIADFDATDFIL